AVGVAERQRVPGLNGLNPRKLEAAVYPILPSAAVRPLFTLAEGQFVVDDADEPVVPVKTGAPFFEPAVLDGRHAGTGVISVLAVDRLRIGIEAAEVRAPRHSLFHFHRARMESRVAKIRAREHVAELRERPEVLRRREHLVLQCWVAGAKIDRERIVLPAFDQADAR